MEGNEPRNSWQTALRYLLSPFLTDEEKLARLAGSSLAECAGIRDFLTAQGVLPLVRHELLRLGLPVATCIQSDTVDRAFMGNVLSAKRSNDVLQGILAAATSADIPVLVMRTPYLIKTLYGGNYGLRSFRDIDIAVMPGDVRGFLQCLDEAGMNVRALDDRCAQIRKKASLGARLELIVEGTLLDLHWELGLHYNFCRAKKVSGYQRAIWGRAEKVSADWGSHYVMSPGDQLCHLVEHAAIQHDMGGMLYRNLLEIGSACAALIQDGEVMTAWELSRERRSSIAFSATLNALEGVIDTNGQFKAIDQRILTAPGTATKEAERRIGTMWLGANAGAVNEVALNQQAELEASAQTMAAFMEGGTHKLAFMAALFIPSRQLAEYPLDVSLTWFQYLALLLRHYVTLYRFIPVIPRLTKTTRWEYVRARSEATLRNRAMDDRGSTAKMDSNFGEERLHSLSKSDIREIQKVLNCSANVSGRTL
jgi:hypothetical protein